MRRRPRLLQRLGRLGRRGPGWGGRRLESCSARVRQRRLRCPEAPRTAHVSLRACAAACLPAGTPTALRKRRRPLLRWLRRRPLLRWRRRWGGGRRRGLLGGSVLRLPLPRARLAGEKTPATTAWSRGGVGELGGVHPLSLLLLQQCVLMRCERRRRQASICCVLRMLLPNPAHGRWHGEIRRASHWSWSYWS
jgi:hypothetical protein